ncbi:MAG: diacylglycerol kinase family protein [Dysgonamonadaceae bacterium]
MKKTKVCAIVNPVSGTSSKDNIPLKITESLDALKYEVEVKITEYPSQATTITQEAVKNGFDIVIAVGGDGTVNEIARALVDTNCTLGILPLGSGNGLARDLKISLNLDEAINVIKENNVRVIDYGIANEHIFFCTCGVGFDAFVSKKFDEDVQRGRIGYFKNIMEGFAEFKSEEYEITYDGGVLKEQAFIVTCANASQYGFDAVIAPGADMEDGKLNVSILKPMNALEVPVATFQLFAKTLDKNHKVITLETSNITIKRKHDGYLQIDGEPLNAGKEINIKVIPKGLRVLVPTIMKTYEKENQNIFNALTRWFSNTQH